MRNLIDTLSIIFLAGFLVLCPFITDSQASSKTAYIIELNNDSINPITAEYIAQAIDKANDTNAACLILKLDTPGGLLDSTRSIVKKIMSSKVPVITYISPSGSRAGSAGVFITYASHIAAMAPSTNIGAAHPIQMGKQDKQKDIWDGLKELLEKKREGTSTSAPKSPDPKSHQDHLETQENIDAPPDNQIPQDMHPDEDALNSKILQDSTAFIRSLAQKRNRNVAWAVKSVTKSSSITATEALDLGVIDFIAKDENELFEKLNGRTVQIQDNEIILETNDIRAERIPMDFRQQLFNILANPNIAYLLMILGFYGLLYEVTHPGFGVPGILGTIFLILAFFSMQTLPTNYAGLALVILGLAFFIAEASAPGIGLFAVGGIISMLLGSLLLFDSSVPMMRVSFSLILSFTLTTAGITIFLVGNVIRAHRQKVISGQEGLIGEEGEVTKTIRPSHAGKVFVHGELWNAYASDEIKKGEKIIIAEVHGMKLKVKKA